MRDIYAWKKQTKPLNGTKFSFFLQNNLFSTRYILSELSIAEKETSTPSIRKLAKQNSRLFAQAQSTFEDV